MQLTYDPYQMVEMAQRLGRDQVVWCDEFSADKTSVSKTAARPMASGFRRDRLGAASADIRRLGRDGACPPVADP